MTYQDRFPMTQTYAIQKSFQLLALAAFTLLLFAVFVSPDVYAEPSVQEMVDALAPKQGPENPVSRTRTRGINTQKTISSAGQLQLSVQFEFASATITAESRRLLSKLGSAMNAPALTQTRFRIEGHTDAAGDAQVNLRLSERRAESVRQFLATNANVKADRLSAEGKGSSNLIDPKNPTAAVNRRVVVVALEEAAAVSSAPSQRIDTQQSPPIDSEVTENSIAGTVQKVQGEISVIRSNLPVKLDAGDSLREGDTITASSASSALVQLDDGAKLLIRPNTKVSLSRIVNIGALDKLSHSIALAFGAIRYVTGAVGKARPKGVSFSTPTATVGIRGTDIEIVYAAKTRSVQGPGTYVRVNSGTIELDGTDGSTVMLATNEQAFAGAQGTKTRSGTRSPAVRKLDAPVEVFSSGQFDSLINSP